jgi:hypothetical protein
MGTPSYNRRQGEFELRVLKDGRLVLMGPDEALVELAQAFEDPGAAAETDHSESPHVQIREPERRPPADDR